MRKKTDEPTPDDEDAEEDEDTDSEEVTFLCMFVVFVKLSWWIQA